MRTLPQSKSQAFEKAIVILISSTLLQGCLKSESSLKTSEAPAAHTTNSYEGHGAQSLKPEVIAEFAPPPLAPDLKKQIEFMLDVRASGSGFVSNDGQDFYFTWAVTGRPQVWRINQAEGFPVQLTGGEDRTWIAGLMPNEKFLIVQRDRAGEENPGLYLLKATGGRLKKIFHKEGVQTELNLVSPDGEYIYFSANDPKPDAKSIYRYEMSSGNVQKIFDRPGLWSVADQKGSDRLLLTKYVGARQTEFYEWNLNTQKLTSIFGQDKKEEIWMSYGPGETDFIVLTNMFGNFKRLYSLKDGAFAPITGDLNYDVIAFNTDIQKNFLSYTVNRDGLFQSTLLSLKDSLKPIEIKAPKAEEVQLGGFSWNGKYISASIENSDEPSTTYVVDLQKMVWKKRLLPSAPEVDLESFAEASVEYFDARDGSKVPMLVRRPMACKDPCPIIVNFHGGPEAQSLPGFSTFAQIFVDAGFIFVEPNVRGSDGYGKDYLNADNGPKRLDVITDIEDVSKHLRATYPKSKMGVMGGSYGGYSTLMAMTRFAGAYDAGASIVGMSNLLSFLQNTAPYRRQLRISEYGDPEKDRDALIELSPTTYLDSLKDPLLIMQGVSDPRVPAGEALQIHQLLQNKGVASQLILFANEGHGSVERGNRVLQLGHILGFFKKHLQAR